ncbi:hypothetical protein BC829DRAFT_397308 [Chytridium lagenaria]|nr:hypothetical protein BC829DRAFT_397308 [Chytridium lagenaria]
MEFLKAVLSAMPETSISDGLKATEIWQFYLDYKTGIVNAIDHLHETNVAFRHNSGEASLAIDRHRAGIDRLVSSSSSARRLTPELSERLHLESTMLQLSTENNRLCEIVKAQTEHFEAQSVINAEIAKFYGRNIIAVYETISNAAKSSNASEIQRQMEILQISAQVVSLVLGKQAGSPNRILPQDTDKGVEAFENVPIIYDTASESESEGGDVEMTDSESVMENEEMDGAWDKAVHSFAHGHMKHDKENIFVVQNASLATAAEESLSTTVKRRRLERKISEDIEYDDQDFNTPTKARLRSRTPNVDPDSTPLARPRARSIHSAKGKPLTVNHLAENKEPTTERETDKLKGGLEETASPKKLRRRQARQSFIPKMRLTPMKVTAPNANVMTVPSKLAVMADSAKRNVEISGLPTQRSRLKRPMETVGTIGIGLDARTRRMTRSTSNLRATGEESGWETLTDGSGVPVMVGDEATSKRTLRKRK